MRWWRRFDASEVKRDFVRLRNGGFDSVRIFLLWEDFQPAPETISDVSLEALVTVADIAAQNELAIVPTFFTGHMSGVNWFPSWATEPSTEPGRFRLVSDDKVIQARPRNWYSDRLVLEAQSLLAREVATTLHDHAALWAYDLGNENSNCVVPPSRAAGVNWLQRIAGEIRAVDPKHPITIGLHGEDLEEDRLIGPREAAIVCDFLCMHGYPLYSAWARHAVDAMILPYLGLLTAWMGKRDVLFEEFGAPTAPRDPRNAAQACEQSLVQLLNEEEAAAFSRHGLEQLCRFGFLGAMFWCYADYCETLWTEPPLDRAPHERYFGLWRADGSAKPVVDEVKSFGKFQRPGLRSIERPNAGPQFSAQDFEWIDITVDEFYRNPRENISRLYDRFRQAYG
jgi:endo-1,4-beta-mannosidase